jgi:hypothetical protein
MIKSTASEVPRADNKNIRLKVATVRDEPNRVAKEKFFIPPPNELGDLQTFVGETLRPSRSSRPASYI